MQKLLETLNDKKKKINQRDSRGYILDIFVQEPKDHCTIVTFKKNAVRGNHFHKKSTQYSFILEGKLNMYTSRINKKSQLKNKIKKKIVKENDLIIHKLLAFADGTRGGKNYEKDTFRLKKKLI